jgi:hypothetical protein
VKTPRNLYPCAKKKRIKKTNHIHSKSNLHTFLYPFTKWMWDNYIHFIPFGGFLSHGGTPVDHPVVMRAALLCFRLLLVEKKATVASVCFLTSMYVNASHFATSWMNVFGSLDDEQFQPPFSSHIMLPLSCLPNCVWRSVDSVPESTIYRVGQVRFFWIQH